MITTAVQRGSYVYVYGDKNRQLYSKLGELAGFTGSAVSVKRGYVYVYDEKGRQIGAHYSKWAFHLPGPTILGFFIESVLFKVQKKLRDTKLGIMAA